MIQYISPDQLNVGRIDQQNNSVKSTQKNLNAGQDFKTLLTQKVQQSDLKFSSHASKRLEMRGIVMNERDIETLKQAVDLAESKGSRDALILHEKAAFVVSVRNRTVITAIDDSNMKDNIVTNIDSAVIARDL